MVANVTVSVTECALSFNETKARRLTRTLHNFESFGSILDCSLKLYNILSIRIKYKIPSPKLNRNIGQTVAFTKI